MGGISESQCLPCISSIVALPPFLLCPPGDVDAVIIPALPLPLLGVVDAVLIPEIPFTLKGPNGLFEYLAGVLKAKGDCVICIAEGAGQVRGRSVGG